MEWIGSTISAVINGGWKIYLAAFIASATLLFLPETLVGQLGLEEIRHAYRTYAGVAFVASASLLDVNVISIIVQVALCALQFSKVTTVRTTFTRSKVLENS